MGLKCQIQSTSVALNLELPEDEDIDPQTGRLTIQLLF